MERDDRLEMKTTAMPTTETPDPISISCDECSLEGTSACEDCVVSYLLGGEETEDAMIVDVMEARAIRMLHGAGLLPELRFQQRVG
jgi:hypothetical protein